MYDPQLRYTLEEYWKLIALSTDRKYEYVDGQIRLMTGGSPAHGQLANRIGGMLDAALRYTDCNVYSSDVALALADFRSYYPDVSVSCDPADWTLHDRFAVQLQNSTKYSKHASISATY